MSDYINYYDLLGVDKNATEDEIRKAYRQQAKKWHPDLNKDENAPEMARKINEAKEILLDKDKRKEYDYYLNNYKNNIYENLNKKKNDNSSDSYNNNYYEEKTYTKWEYFKLYLKFYNVSIFRKILAVILVLFESLLCFILQSINYLLAFILSYFGVIISYILGCASGIALLFLVVKVILSINTSPDTFSEYFLFITGIIVSFSLSVLIIFIPDFLIDTVSVLISDLNMFLFKLSIGYKK